MTHRSSVLQGSVVATSTRRRRRRGDPSIDIGTAVDPKRDYCGRVKSSERVRHAKFSGKRRPLVHKRCPRHRCNGSFRGRGIGAFHLVPLVFLSCETRGQCKQGTAYYGDRQRRQRSHATGVNIAERRRESDSGARGLLRVFEAPLTPTTLETVTPALILGGLLPRHTMKLNVTDVPR